MSMRLSSLWNWRGTIDRWPYFVWGVVLAMIKYNIDRIAVWIWSGERWSLLDYTRFGEYLWPQLPDHERLGEFALMLAWSLPFMAAGVILTLQRLRSARLSPWLVLLFFAPVIKLFFFLLLSLIPSRETREGRRGDPKAWLGSFIPRNAKGAATVGVLAAIANGILCVWLGTTVLRQYGWPLFVGVPFALGFISVLVYGYHEQRSLGPCMRVAAAATCTAGLSLLAVALEGLICLVMALPLALPMALLGGFVAYTIQASDWWHGNDPRTFCVALVAPALMAVEHFAPPQSPLFPVTTAVHVQASPSEVWRNVVSFSELKPPREFIFRAGIAYPQRARIQGHGPGAVRHCEFSTGAFVEPIEIWDEPRLLRFSVTENPAPMAEWTPYRDVHPPHLEGFLVSRAGQFRLTARPDGSTLLEGTTWYQHNLWPATYWRGWSDYIIHTIHLRVLQYVKELSENSRAEQLAQGKATPRANDKTGLPGAQMLR